MSVEDQHDGADQFLDETDVAMLAALGRLVDGADPAPRDLVERCTLAMSLAMMDAELMAIAADSQPAHSVRAEAAASASTVTFTSAQVSVMVDISQVAGRVRLDGWVAPASELIVELRRADGHVVTTTCDAEGRFVLDAVPHGLAGLVLRGAGDDGPRLTTPLLEL
ncbi:hypothetical protein ACTVCO_02775 [Sanguibacter sp. A247]|uniref:hypothetical protein n=1 Tax=unclassified Sanguibacter TaxID=2645534 RepID=UPI003FD8BC41